MKKFFKLEENNTTVGTEFVAGLTTFFAMSYILFVNPSILAIAGMPSQAVFLATIISAVIATLIMGLFANVPYAQAPGMGMNAFFTYTVVLGLGYSWKQALAMVFLCGIVNIIITVTKFRKLIIQSIPESLQHAIAGGIGIFVAYVGFKNLGILSFTLDAKPVNNALGGADIVPGLATFNQPAIILGLIGLVITAVLVLKNVKGGIFISIILTTIIGILMGVVDVQHANLTENSLGKAFKELGTTFGAAFGSEGMGSLFTDVHKIPQVILTVIAFSLSDTFDTIGTFIGTGRKTGIFSQEEEDAFEDGSGIHTKMDRALFSDAIATVIGSVFGTSNTTTYVESAAGIGAGGRTGLTSVFVAILFLISSLLAPLIGLIPTQATAPALIMVGVMMMSSFKDIDWGDMDEALPAFFASVFMGLCYSISYGIAGGFIFYVIVKLVKGKAKEISWIVWLITFLFILNFVALAIL